MGKLASVFAAAAGVAVFAYLTGPTPPDRSAVERSAAQNTSSHQITKAATGTSREQPRTFSAPPVGRVALAKEIEAELHRLGCYAGPTSGAWNDQARQAMQSVTQRAAVRLPVEQPDYILLTLARRLPGPVCTTPCVGTSDCTTTAANGQRPTATLIPSSGQMAPRVAAPVAVQRQPEPWRATVKGATNKETAEVGRAKREAERAALADRQRRLAVAQEGRSDETRGRLILAEQQRQAELALLEARRRQETVQPGANSALPAGRMSLGVVQLPGETRDAPLTSVATAPQPGIPAANPVTTIAPETTRVGDLPRPDEVPKRAARRQRDASVQPVARPPSHKRKAWTRTIFQDMSRNGP